MPPRHRAAEPSATPPDRLLGPLAAAPLDRATARAMADLVSGALRQVGRTLTEGPPGCVRAEAHPARLADPGVRSAITVTMARSRAAPPQVAVTGPEGHPQQTPGSDPEAIRTSTTLTG